MLSSTWGKGRLPFTQTQPHPFPSVNPKSAQVSQFLLGRAGGKLSAVYADLHQDIGPGPTASPVRAAASTRQ